jgi:hypothetical protein
LGQDPVAGVCCNELLEFHNNKEFLDQVVVLFDMKTWNLTFIDKLTGAFMNLGSLLSCTRAVIAQSV